VDWAPEKAGVALQRLTVRIINTTDEKLDVDATVAMLAPGADERTKQALTRASIEPQGEVDVPIELGTLAVQTSGVATPLQVVVTYQGSADVTPPGAPQSEQTRPLNTTSTSMLYVTHADDFRSATIRNEADEARRNGELLKAGELSPLRAMKINGTDVSGEELAKLPVQTLVSGDFVPPEFGPRPTAVSDTEESTP
jgi:hypothetical protein